MFAVGSFRPRVCTHTPGISLVDADMLSRRYDPDKNYAYLRGSVRRLIERERLEENRAAQARAHAIMSPPDPKKEQERPPLCARDMDRRGQPH